ncbi:MAG: serine/threonine-protein phosphatase [Phycisphaeraceae bacterium]|nr:serine/threonine-protein phosphatase [Phycisphaeraceae bacterium]
MGIEGSVTTLATEPEHAPPCDPCADQPEQLRLHCMEIWGGNAAEDAAISVPGIDIWVRANPALGGDKGGDIHYVSTCGAGKLARFVVADVSGHGPSVGEVSDALRRQMRRHINTPLQTSLVRALSDEFGNSTNAGQFATGIFASFHAPTNELILVNAGHPRPMLRRASTGVWELIRHDAPQARTSFKDLPLGVIEGAEYSQFVVPMEPGDVALFFTDALPETTDAQTGRMLGEAGLLELMADITSDRGFDPSTIGALLCERLDEIRGRPCEDDVTLMTLHHNGAGPDKPSLGEMARVFAKMLGLMKV